MKSKLNGLVTFIYTHDLTQSANFYETILGLPMWLDQGSCRIYSIAENAFIGVCQISEGSKGRSSAAESDNIILTLVSDDVDACYEELVNKGVSFDKPPSLNEKYNIYHCFLRDPNGYLIEIQRFLD